MRTEELAGTRSEVARARRPPTPSLWRRQWYAAPGRQLRLVRPVISVGNLSVGGRGKTPTVAHLARILVEAGERPAILTRGYARARTEDGVVVVSDGVHLLADVDRSGDEPLMLAKTLPGSAVLVCDHRALAGALAERALGATIHLLDDGFQHLQLARDLDIVIVTAEDLDDRPVPFGRLREPVAALAHADAIVVDGSTVAPAAFGSTPTFALRRALGALAPLEPDRSWPESRGRVVAVAGIARPERFFRALAEAGWTVAESVSFPDHHRYSARDLTGIAHIATRAGAPVLTTAKDAMRLLAMRPLPVPMAFVPLDVTIEPAAAFRDWLFARLREARA
jgi:tetraacyldisaccharide 4'-kinase